LTSGFGHALVTFGSSFDRPRFAAIGAKRDRIGGECEEEIFEALIRFAHRGGEQVSEGA
tara:strand:- start:121 stop:297 length:177 start_codon:yes stop_codon:yes gene_type:complete